MPEYHDHRCVDKGKLCCLGHAEQFKVFGILNSDGCYFCSLCGKPVAANDSRPRRDIETEDDSRA